MKHNYRDLARDKKRADAWRRRVRNFAREYVAELLRNNDTPDWATDRGLSHAELIEFDNEVKRISDRVRKTIISA